MTATTRTAIIIVCHPPLPGQKRVTLLRRISLPARKPRQGMMKTASPYSLCLMPNLPSSPMMESCCKHLLRPTPKALHPDRNGRTTRRSRHQEMWTAMIQKGVVYLTVLPDLRLWKEMKQHHIPSEQIIHCNHQDGVELVLYAVARSANVAQTRCACLYELAFLRRFLLSRRLRRSQAHTVPSFFIKL